MIKYLFSVNGTTGKVTSGIVLEYDDTPITVQVPVLDENGEPVLDADGKPTYTDEVQPAPVPAYPSEYTTEGTKEVWLNQHRARHVEGEWVLDPEVPIDPVPLPPNTEEKIAQLEAEKAELESRLEAAESAILFLMDM